MVKSGLDAFAICPLDQVKEPLLGFGDGNAAVPPEQAEVVRSRPAIRCLKPIRGQPARFVFGQPSPAAAGLFELLLKLGPGGEIAAHRLAVVARPKRLPDLPAA